jgi:hypothetical protein
MCCTTTTITTALRRHFTLRVSGLRPPVLSSNRLLLANLIYAVRMSTYAESKLAPEQ